MNIKGQELKLFAKKRVTDYLDSSSFNPCILLNRIPRITEFS